MTIDSGHPSTADIIEGTDEFLEALERIGRQIDALEARALALEASVADDTEARLAADA
jgi:hypothetical protein